MTTLLINIIITSAMITGIYIACNWPGMIFYRICRYIQTYAPEMLINPFFVCPICMSSVWSVVYCIITHQISWMVLIQIPAVAGVNTFVAHYLNQIRYGSELERTSPGE